MIINGAQRISWVARASRGAKMRDVVGVTDEPSATARETRTLPGRSFAGSKLVVCLLLLTFAFVLPAVRAESDDEVQARKTALDLAGAFTNDGFKIRDGHWSGTIKPHEHALIAVNLYAGNQYWFAAGANESGKKVGVEIYDETGRQVPVENYTADEKAAAGFLPTNSGQYFISVSLLEGEPSSVCLVCSYK